MIRSTVVCDSCGVTEPFAERAVTMPAGWTSYFYRDVSDRNSDLCPRCSEKVKAIRDRSDADVVEFITCSRKTV